MRAEAYAIASIIREYSEETMCAGWYSGVEFDLWDRVQHARSLGRLATGPGKKPEYFSIDDRIKALAELADACDGWVVYGEDGERYVTTAEMKTLYARDQVKSACETLQRYGVPIDVDDMLSKIAA